MDYDCFYGRLCKILLFLFTIPQIGFNQTSFSGQVFEDEMRNALAGVEVLILPGGQTNYTDKAGNFSFKNLPAGELQLVLYRYGYATQQVLITQPSADSIYQFTLSPLLNNLSEVLVAEARESIYATTRLRAVEGTAIYAGKKNEVVLLDQLNFNAATNNSRQLYGQVSGLNIYENNDAGLQLNIGGRGLDPNRSAGFNTRQNGYDISADVLGYPESYYTPPAEALERIEVIRGAASLQYGTQFGGLVNFIFRPSEKKSPLAVTTRQTVGSNGLFTSFNSLSGTKGRFSYYTYYHRKQGDGFRPNAGFASDHAFARLAYQFSPKTTLSAEYTYLSYLAQQPGGLTDAQFYLDPNFSNRTRNWFAVNWNLLALRLDHRFSTRTDFSLQLFGLDADRSALGFRTNRVSQIDDLSAPRDLLIGTFLNGGAEARLLHRYSLGGRSAVLLVGSKYYQSDNTAIQGPGSAKVMPDFQLATETFPDYPDQSNFSFPNQNIAWFGEHIFYLSDRLTITPGLRYEYISTASEGNFQRLNFDLAGNVILRDTFTDNRTLTRNLLLLGIGSSYRSSDKLEIYGNFSQNYRSVTFNDIRVVNPSFQIDPNISDERGFNADLGLRGRSRHFAYDVNIFGLLYDNRLGEVLRPEMRTTAEGIETETGRIIRFRGNIGRALIYGWESLLEASILSSASGRSTRPQLHAFVNLALIGSEYLDTEIAGVSGKQVEFIPSLNLKTGLRFSHQRLRGSLQYAYLSEQFTDATNAPQNRRDNQSGIRGSIPAYGVMDLSLAYSWKNFSVEGGVNNLLNNTYFTRRATGYPGPGIIPSAPRTVYLTVVYRGKVMEKK